MMKKMPSSPRVVMIFIMGVSQSILTNFSKNSKMERSKLSIASKTIVLSYFLYIIALIGKKCKSFLKNILFFAYDGEQTAIIISKGDDVMNSYFTNNPAVKAEFDKLPQSVRNMIIESGVRISSVEDLRKTADAIMKND